MFVSYTTHSRLCDACLSLDLLNYARRTAVRYNGFRQCVYRYHTNICFIPINCYWPHSLWYCMFGRSIYDMHVNNKFSDHMNAAMRPHTHERVCIHLITTSKTAHVNMLNILLNLCLTIFPGCRYKWNSCGENAHALWQLVLHIYDFVFWNQNEITIWSDPVSIRIYIVYSNINYK